MLSRPNGILVIITTAGRTTDCPCYVKEYTYIDRCMRDESELSDDYFHFVAELDVDDDIFDESVWLKANPLQVSIEVGLDGLRSLAKGAKEVSENLGEYMTKNMNLWVNMLDATYVDMPSVVHASVDIDLSELEPATIVGVDLSATTDLTAITWVRRYKGSVERYAVFSHAFMPREKYNERRRIDKWDYDAYHAMGHLSLTDGKTVDYEQVRQFIYDMPKRFGVKIRMICYDAWNAFDFVQTLERKSFNCVQVPQNLSHLSEPTKRYRKDLYDGNAVIARNPLYLKNLEACVLRVDTNANIRIDKSKSNKRIDMVAATINAVAHIYDLPKTPRIREI